MVSQLTNSFTSEINLYIGHLTNSVRTHFINLFLNPDNDIMKLLIDIIITICKSIINYELLKCQYKVYKI